MTDLDLLAVGPHPDDVELFCGGTVATSAARGHRVGILDLTRGERASNGTVETRAREAAAAAAVLGVAVRENLGLPDAGLDPYAGVDGALEGSQLLALVAAIRRLRPRILLLPHTRARHPDHAAAGTLGERAVFTAGLRSVETDAAPFRPRRTLHYACRHGFSPRLIVDTTDAIETKRAALACYASQVAPAPGAVDTMVAAPLSSAALEARDRYYGAMIGVAFGEAFTQAGPVGVHDLVDHARQEDFGEPFLVEDA